MANLKTVRLGLLELNNSDPSEGFVISETNLWKLVKKDLNLQPQLQEGRLRVAIPAL